MIRHLLPSVPLTEIKDDLSYTCRRLLKDPRTAYLALDLVQMQARLAALQQDVAKGSAGPQDVELFVTALNEQRCTTFGRLTGLACVQGLDAVWPGNFFRSIKAESTAAVPGVSAARGPASTEDWIAVAEERGSDARALTGAGPRSVGAVYMAGYGIECGLKALHKRQNRPFPTARSAGHDLRGLWESAGFRLSDLQDKSGAKAFFLERWSTDLRYEKQVDSNLSSGDLVDGAGALTAWILTRVKRGKNR